MPSSHLILCRPLLLLLSLFPSIRVFSRESALCISWPKFWSFSIRPPHEYSGLISFRIDLFVLLSVQGTLKCLLQHHNWKASIPRRSGLFMVQLSYLYVTIGKAISLTIRNFVYKVINFVNKVSAFFFFFFSAIVNPIYWGKREGRDGSWLAWNFVLRSPILFFFF